ncbi:MAG TPA: esterase [Armatimonadetes bacterium]|nr:esterase [Armatimonadota bacterium]
MTGGFAVRWPLLLLGLAICGAEVQAQPPAPVVSPTVNDDRTVTFRLRAPGAEGVALICGDMPGVGRREMDRGEGGVWSVTVGPVPAGAYRYEFQVGGVKVIDPANPLTSAANATTFSLVVVPGSSLFDTRDVPHGAVARVEYPSSLGLGWRRAHVYTPPGYEAGRRSYPVLFLLHGATDSDESWVTVGRAGAILDNLIAADLARPMIVVMPNGHRSQRGLAAPGGLDNDVDNLAREVEVDLLPLVEARYRVRSGAANRAVAGLSMGGAQSLQVALTQPGQWGYVGVFSSGIFALRDDEQSAAWPAANAARLAAARRNMKVCWFAIGTDDFLLDISRRTVTALRDADWPLQSTETGGGHVWMVWREYLAEFVQLLFKP